MECYKVCVLTSTRADYGLLRNLLFRLKDNPVINLDLLVSGTHLSETFGNTQTEILKDGFFGYNSLPIPLDEDSSYGMACSTGKAVVEFATYFANNRPDILVVLGDRFEVLSAVIAAHFNNIPIAHISGGDVTEGAIDDSIRHSITKMSQLHFPGCKQSANRIIQMGEQPSTVFNVGEPGIENCLNAKLLTRDSLVKEVGFPDLLSDYCVVTYHPVTLDKEPVEIQVRTLIKAMDRFPKISFLITLANADAGGRTINEIWWNESKNHPNWKVVTSLGVIKYLSSVKYSLLVLGNSSSGIVEAPVLGIPTVNIGTRQRGRMLACSIVSCGTRTSEIVEAMNTAFDKDFKDEAKHVVSPFGDGTTSSRIEKVLVDYLEKGEYSIAKHFYDIGF